MRYAAGVVRHAAVVLLALAAACEAPAPVGSGCARNTDCVAPLACTYGRCRAQCIGARDCAPGLRCIATAAGPGVCTLAPEERCTPAVCAPPLACIEGQCRTSCEVDTECRTGACTAGSCVEPVASDADASIDADTDAGASIQCDTSGWPADQALLDGLFAAALTGPAGLRALTPVDLGPFATPTDAGAPLPGQVAIAAHADGASGRGWVAWIEGAALTPRFIEVPLDDPGAHVLLDLDGGSIGAARTLDLGVDGSSFVGVVARTPPGGAASFAWIIDEDATSRLTGVAAPAAFAADGVFGRAAVTGGLSPFGGAASLGVRFVVPSGDVLRLLERAAVPGASYPTSEPPGFVDGAGSLGELYALRDPIDTSIALWDVSDGYTDSITPVAATSDGPPGVAVIGSDPITAILAYPTTRTITRHVVVCGGGCSIVGPALVGTAESVAARRVALATLGSGVVMVGAFSDGSGAGTYLRMWHVAADGTLAPVGTAWSGPSVVDGESIVDLRVAAAPASSVVTGPRQAGVLVAVLIRDAASGMDRVWLGGVYGCAP